VVAPRADIISDIAAHGMTGTEWILRSADCEDTGKEIHHYDEDRRPESPTPKRHVKAPDSQFLPRISILHPERAQGTDRVTPGQWPRSQFFVPLGTMR